MNRRAFLRSPVAMVVAAQYGPGASLFGVEPRMPPVFRGELGTLDCGFRFIGMDLAREPDQTAVVQQLPGGGWAMVVPPDPGIEWERALRGDGAAAAFNHEFAKGVAGHIDRTFVRALRGEG